MLINSEISFQKKLPGNPILVIAPSGIGTSSSPRQHKWVSQLGALGMVVTVYVPLGLTSTKMTMMACIDQLVQATRTKIQEVRSDCPGRPIILLGYNTGAALACQVFTFKSKNCLDYDTFRK